MAIKALTFDVFGTVVDWRSSIFREGEAFGRSRGITGVDWQQLRRPLARHVPAGHGRGAERPAPVREARRPAPREPGQARGRVRDQGAAARRSSIISTAPGTGSTRGPTSVPGLDAAEAQVHPGDPVERQCRAHGQHGQARGAAVGHHSRRRGDAPLQAAAGVLPGHRGLPRASSRPRSRWWPRTMATSPPRARVGFRTCFVTRPTSTARARPRTSRPSAGLGLHRPRLPAPRRRAWLLTQRRRRG